MKFSIAKLPKPFYKKTEKTQKTHKELSLFKDRKIQIFVTMEEKILSLGKFSAVATGAKGALPSISGGLILLKIHFWNIM